MESSYSEEDGSNSWESPRRQTVADRINNNRMAANVGGSIDEEEEEEEEKTAADVQLKAVLGNTNQLRQHHARHTPMNRHNDTSNNSSLEEDANLHHGIDLSGSEERVRASGRRLLANSQFESRNTSTSRQRTHHHHLNNNSGGQQVLLLSEEALRMKDSQTSPPKEGGSFMFRGYRGFIDKTKDVPNLMDDAESEGGTSMGTGVYSFSGGDARKRQQQQQQHAHHTIGLALPSSSQVESASDVFEGIIQEEQFGPIEEDILDVNSEEYRMPLKTESCLPYSTQFNPFAASRLPPPSQHGVSQTKHIRDFERHGPDNQHAGPALNLSAVTRGSSDSSPHHLDYIEDEEDGFESLPDLTMYYIQPDVVRKLVRAFRKICTNQMEISSSEETMLHDFENLVDTKKAFALFEMRSRIMETDIDRGLERKGGTNVEDDIVVTPFFQASARVRDAVIVSKAWRDGATPKDVVTAHLLTRRSAKAHFVPRQIQRLRRRGAPSFHDEPEYWFEEVTWLDDTDFMLMRCQSLGAGTMKGFEMFTIGDCQSMLLKMTSDNCTVSIHFSVRISY